MQLQDKELRTYLIAATAGNALLAVLDIVGIVINRLTKSYNMFLYYTEDSNYIALIASVMFVIFGVIALTKGTDVPKWVYILRYVATCLLTVTFTVVVFILAPALGEFKDILFGDALLYHHTLCPIIAILLFALVERGPKLGWKHTLIALAPTALYGAVLVPLNALELVKGPYPFLRVNQQPWYESLMWLAIVVGGAYLIAVVFKFVTHLRKK